MARPLVGFGSGGRSFTPTVCTARPVVLRTAPLGLLCVLAGNGYIVGINQLCDLEIDRINKPWLPVAAGSISPAWGAILCAALGTLGLLLSWVAFDGFVAALYTAGLLIGTAYSAPPLRLKRSPAGTRCEWFATGFGTCFAAAIAILKDLPDVDGDQQHGISTFASRWGLAATARVGASLLGAFYCVAGTLLALRAARAPRSLLAAASQFAALAALLRRSGALQGRAAGARAGRRPPLARPSAPKSARAAADFYAFIWRLFYLQYCVLVLL
ncbi:hypothetical protein QBZ16_003548 [Prototheca wickerhamii]|uniref:Uncharacterized protein n=1 Tax=Prototheca wickerhamii TaxID=3111 RepID=A0AAD9MLU8_PROWI|nr:hypothetical protein QBZ16_003548 [Prototheca wickerhamii]